ncbi:hypothetical protein OC835_005995 [Tilletia horrida]|nr:hypothetical protein OC835_005995 [Tilletia horrida]
MTPPISAGPTLHPALPVVLHSDQASPISQETGSEKAASVVSSTAKERDEHQGRSSTSSNRDDLVEPENEAAPYRLVDAFRFGSSRRRRYDPDSIATVRTAFDDEKLEPHYRPPPEWENTKNYDPNFRWTHREQDEVTRVLDKRVLFYAMAFFAILNIDRNNTQAANSDGILKDLGMTTNDFNTATSLFRGMFLLAELPGQALSKRFGPDRFIPFQMALWGILTIAQMGLSGKSSYFACRALLGIAQGSFIPDLLIYLSYFYTKKQLPIRLALFWVAMQAANGTAALFSAGILEMRGVGGLAGWRWLFFWEGLLSILFAVIAWFAFVPSPSQAKWLNEKQAKIVVNRVLRDDAGKHQMHNRAALTWRHFVSSVTNWRFYPLFFIGILFGIPQSPPQTYLTLSLRGFGFSRIVTQALSSVQYWLAIPTGLAVVLLSDVLQERALVALVQDLWILPMLITILGLGKNAKPWTYFGLVTLIGGAPYTHPTGSIISANIYRADDKPLYRRGNIVLVSICSFNILFYIGTRFFYRALNASRERRWNAMSTDEKARYLAEHPPSNRRIDFRFEY